MNVIVSRLTRGVSNVSRLPASTEDDLQLPFLVDDALQKDKDDLDSDSSEGGVWLHARDVKFAIPQSYVQKAAKNLGVVDMNALNAPRAQILDGVSNVFGPSLTGILGPSGCGKTSFLDILAGRKTLGTWCSILSSNFLILSQEYHLYHTLLYHKKIGRTSAL